VTVRDADEEASTDLCGTIHELEALTRREPGPMSCESTAATQLLGGGAMSRRFLRVPQRQSWLVVGLTCVLILASALLWLLDGRQHQPLVGPLVPWWVVAAAFALTESAVLHVQSRREAQTVSISELPLVVALFLADPGDLLLGRLVGSVAIMVLVRRSSALKVFFNVALFALEAVVALVVFQALAGDVPAVGPREWTAALAAVLSANAVGSVALGLVIGIYEGGTTVRSLAREAVTSQLFAPGVVVLGLVAVICVDAGGWNPWMVGAAVVVLTICYRKYSSLFDRHVNLERLYEFSQAVGQSPDKDVVVGLVLHEVRELLTSDRARLVIRGGDDRIGSLRISLSESGELEHATLGVLTSDDWVENEVLDDGRSVILPRRSRDRRTRMWLGANDLRDAIAVPLRGADGVLGMLMVGERLGEVRTYGRDDLLLLETVANHASIALQKGQLIEQLQHDALHDPLTGLPNRKHFQRRLDAAIEDTTHERGSVAVVILDLDGFKDVNDTLGHHQGDVVLSEVADRLVKSLGSEGFVARLGGDEFAVLLPRTSPAHAVRSCERIAADLQGPISMEGMQFEVGASMGIAHCADRGTEGSTLMKRADLAMYEAKTSGLRISEYTPGNDTTGARRLALVAELRSALTAGDVAVHVQPQVDVVSGEARSVEALARWTHAELGAVSPAEFIPIAERSGLIAPLTTAVLDASLRAVAGWSDHAVSVAVNLSPRSLLDPSLVTQVRQALERWQVPPQRLVLEVTEGAVMTDPSAAIALLRELEQLGVRLSIDDFGTGYSSLSYLKQLPVHEVKIDRSFVTGLATSAEDHAIVRSIINLGTNLGLDIVAEGVEDQETFDILALMGCTRVQGWFVARPMPIGEATEWLDRRFGDAPCADGEVPAVA
jgi:diguanylate cyclase (GGDEF)-like protein